MRAPLTLKKKLLPPRIREELGTLISRFRLLKGWNRVKLAREAYTTTECIRLAENGEVVGLDRQLSILKALGAKVIITIEFWNEKAEVEL